MSYTISISFIEFLRTFCVYDEIFDEVLCQEKGLLNLKVSKLAQIYVQIRPVFADSVTNDSYSV